MARAYHVDVARHVAGVDAKWIDNMLSHFELPGVAGGRQGTPRRITELGIAHIVLVRRLSDVLGVRIGEAVWLSQRLLSSTAPVEVDLGVEVRVDRTLFLAKITRDIANAAEAIVPARRGRPATAGGTNSGR